MDEAQRERQHVANGTPALFGLIELMRATFNLTLQESLYEAWPNSFLNTTEAMQNGDDLLLIDRSEVLQEIPIWLIIQSARRPNFIIPNNASEVEP